MRETSEGCVEANTLESLRTVEKCLCVSVCVCVCVCVGGLGSILSGSQVSVLK